MSTIIADVSEEYMQLVRTFPLVSIHDDAHAEQAIAVVGRLFDKGTLSEGEQAYVSALVDLIETYEDKTVHFPPVSGVRLVKFLMEQNGLRQADLVSEFGSRSIVSDVLNRRRPLAMSHARRLAKRFHLPADLFMEPETSDNMP